MNYIELTDKALISDNDLSWDDLGGGIKRKIMAHNEQLMLVKVAFEKGAIGTLHQHPHLQMSYVAEGSFDVTVGDHKKVLKKGDVFFAVSNIVHGVVCTEEGLLIDVFNPAREDFL
ncbi:cupin domain-containing protein [Pedobacter insulae]|uniref:Cupin domain-containing protein n=1 Tax=Pedobacter insulae TaxID=414048 RepID=A0A1I2VX72_9SPHI|nr:cupin domain-containing protein [Pedobacter insulae]SFG93662.1 Cupin domain-containing protein [Pedobacter insulae]